MQSVRDHLLLTVIQRSSFTHLVIPPSSTYGPHGHNRRERERAEELVVF